MTPSVNFDATAFEASSNAVQNVINSLDKPSTRRVIIDAAAQAVVNSLRAHFRSNEHLPHASSGFPFFGKPYPKKYFWYGNRGTSIAEQIRIDSSSIDTPPQSDQIALATIAINSPSLRRILTPNPKPIRPKAGRKFLAIPASPLAASFTGMPRDFPGGLKLAYSRLPNGRWLPSLVAASAPKPKSKYSSHPPAAPLFWLVRKSNPKHSAPPLPSSLSLSNSVRRVIAAALNHLFS